MEFTLKEQGTCGTKQMFEEVTKKYGENVLPLNKPYAPLEEAETGFGYKGTVLWDSKEDKVLCNECGKWFDWLSPTHLKKHKLTVSDYKKKHGLFKKTALVNMKLLSKRRESARNISEENREKMMANLRNNAQKKTGKRGFQIKNSRGTCDAQLKKRFEDKMQELGKIPALNQLDIRSTLIRRYGSYEKALATWGYGGKYNPNPRKYSREDILEIIKNFMETNKREIFTSDLSLVGLNFKQFTKHFGTFSEAKRIAKQKHPA